jgi:hypothetical protein
MAQHGPGNDEVGEQEPRPIRTRRRQGLLGHLDDQSLQQKHRGAHEQREQALHQCVHAVGSRVAYARAPTYLAVHALDQNPRNDQVGEQEPRPIRTRRRQGLLGHLDDQSLQQKHRGAHEQREQALHQCVHAVGSRVAYARAPTYLAVHALDQNPRNDQVGEQEPRPARSRRPH